MAPYAWLKPEDDGMTWVGNNIADALKGFQFSEFTVSAALEADFAVWATWSTACRCPISLRR